MDSSPDGPKYCKNCPDVYKCGGATCAALKAIVDAWQAWPDECYEIPSGVHDAIEAAIKIIGAP